MFTGYNAANTLNERTARRQIFFERVRASFRCRGQTGVDQDTCGAQRPITAGKLYGSVLAFVLAGYRRIPSR